MIKGVAFPPEPIVSNDLKAGAEGDGSRGMGKEGGPREKRIEIYSDRAQYFQTKEVIAVYMIVMGLVSRIH